MVISSKFIGSEDLIRTKNINKIVLHRLDKRNFILILLSVVSNVIF